MLKKEKIRYQSGKDILEGLVVHDDKIKEKMPAVLVAHDWSGRNKFAEQHAERFASLGYVGFALDMYGGGRTGSTKEERISLMSPVINDRAMLLSRIEAALNTVAALSIVDAERIAALGFCFGGLCVLDLARSGANLSGVISAHGLLGAPPRKQEHRIKAKVLVLHGHDDPMVPPSAVLEFQTEMTKAKADWQMNIYGNTKHAFMNPEAHDVQMGTVYDPRAAARGIIAIDNFLNEIFA